MKIINLQVLSMVLSRLSKREKAILYGTVLVVSLTAIDRLIINPIFSKMEALNKQIQEKDAGIKKDLRILAQKERILAEKVKYASFLSSSASEEEEMTSILKEVEALAGKSSVYLVDMKPVGLKKSGSSEKYLINVNCEAQMEQLTEFIYNIESSNKLLSVEKCQINPKSKDSSVVKCSMSIAKIVVK
jgi:Tfp pilus assembly protein PilO